MTVRVVDIYIAGGGMLLAAVLGVFKVADIRGGGEIARGEFMRYFAEAAEGSWSDHQVRDGMKVPMRGEAAWLRPEGRKTYFVGTVRSITYEFSR